MLRSQKAKAIAASLIALPTIGLTPLAAFASKSNFSVQNSHGRASIVKLFVSSAARGSWDNDILGAEILRPGERSTVRFGDRSNNNCLYDFRAEFSDGFVSERFRVDVCNNTGITFY
jgi:hypothetical protein